MGRWSSGWGLLLIATAMTVVPNASAAQSASAGNVTVMLAALEGLSLSRVRDLSFGVAAPGTGVLTVDATSATAGLFHLNGANSRPLTVTFSPPTELTNGAGATIPYTWAATYNENAPDPSAAGGAVPVGANPTTLRTRHNIGGGNRRAYIWIHGSLNVGVVPPDSYTGEFTITATY